MNPSFALPISRTRRRAFALFLGTVILAGCARPATVEIAPGTETRAPEIRVGIVFGAARVQVTADPAPRTLDSDGVPLGEATTWTVVPVRGGLVAQAAEGWRSSRQSSVSLEATRGVLVLDGRAYRGRLTVARDRRGLTVINSLPLEAYLAGVVSAEMGRRDSSDLAALEAQAIVSRTFAIRNLGKRATEGFDLYASVVDQVYGGVASETPLGWQAVRETAGQVVTWGGAPIDAFFFSTCAGQTAGGTEVFAAADRPYLRSISDRDRAGQAFCRISPRYRWQESWTLDQLRSVLRESLPAVTGMAAELAGTVRSVRIDGRTGSDRVAKIAIALSGETVEVEGPLVRQVLRTVGELALRSNAFVLSETRRDGRLAALVADGMGAGHAVGFCQWGAVGRARAGQDAFTILSAYFPGTGVSKAY